MIDQYLLRALRIHRRQRHEGNALLVPDAVLQHLNGFGFVLLDADHGSRDFQHVENTPDAVDDGLRLFLHDAVIRRNVGLTFRGIHEQILDLLLGVELDVHRKSRTAHADCTGTVDGIQKLCTVIIGRDRDGGTQCLLPVGCDLNCLTGCSLGRTVFRDRSDRAGYAGMNIGGELRITCANAFPDRYILAELDNRLTDGADMHLHGYEHLFRDRQVLKRGVC